MRNLTLYAGLFATAAACLAQTALPAGQNTPFRFPGRSVPQLLNGVNGFTFRLPENTIYAVVRLRTITPEVNIQLLVRHGQDVSGTANQPVFSDRDGSENPNKQVQIGFDSQLPVAPGQPYFVALRAAEAAQPIAGVLRLEVQTMTPGGTRVEIAGFQQVMLAGQPDGARFDGATAPLNSPPEPVRVSAGQGIQFQAFGDAFEQQSRTMTGPEGEGYGGLGGSTGGFGISDIAGPMGGMIAVFLGSTINPSAEPPRLNFYSEVRNHAVLRPRLQQSFFVGSGLDRDGRPKTFIAPAGATRLYIGRIGTSPSGAGRTVVRVEVIPAADAPTVVPANPLRISAATSIRLAGQPDGAEASNSVAPIHSPGQLAIRLVAGQALSFRASGSASEGCSRTVNGPAGSPQLDNLCAGQSAANGISGFQVYKGALIGVFLGSTTDRNNPPPAIDYTGPIANVTPLRPLVNQVFLIGDGKTANGSDRKVIVPAGATRLFVSHARADEDQVGSFVVSVSAETPDRPSYTQAGIVNAASSTAGPVSPGSIVSIYGQNLGATASATSVPLPRSLGGTQVYFDTIPAPLYVVTSGQINAQVPWELGSARSALVTVVRDGVAGPATEIELGPYQAGLFSAPGLGVILVNTRTGALVTAQEPARSADVLIAYATGLGLTAGDPRTGEPDTGSPLAVTASPTRVVLSGTAAEREVTPLYAGLAPGFIGVYQLNFVVPPGLGGGTVKMRIDSVAVGGSPTVEFPLAQ